MKPPLHFWIVCGLAAAWNAFGAMDYLLVQSESPAYMAAMPAGQAAFMAAYPPWAEAAWAMAVWLSVAAALLLLLRFALAARAFAAALVFLVAAAIWAFVLADPPLPAVGGGRAVALWAAVSLLAVFQWLYARGMARAGVLR